MARQARGSVVTEFALLAPVILVLMIGVFHVAVYMQNYNAVKSIASDTSRYVMIEYQKGNNPAAEEIRSVALSLATNAPYMLDSDQLDVNVTQAPSSRVNGAIEFNIELTYAMDDWLPLVDLRVFDLSYSRPVFAAIVP
jgi:Flp pilus assembly protein TadG